MRYFTSPSSLTYTEHSSKEIILLNITLTLIITVLAQQCKLAFIPDEIEIDTLSHTINCLVHVSVFICVCELIRRYEFKKARLLLILSFTSYLSMACLLWYVNFNLQYFFLLAMVVLSNLYRGSEEYKRMGTSLALASLFLYFQITLPYPAIKLDWHRWVFVVNACALLVGIFLCTHIIRIRNLYDWKNAKSYIVKCDSLLDDIVHPDLRKSITKSNNGHFQLQDSVTRQSEFVTVLFADMSGFTAYCQKHQTRHLVQQLHDIYSEFDAIAEKLNLMKIKTNGDQYILLSGVKNHTDCKQTICHLAIEFALQANDWFTSNLLNEGMRLKIGIASGPVSTGIIGKSRPAYDVWGEPVNLASRLETLAQTSSPLICSRTHQHIDKDEYKLSSSSHSDVKGFGTVTYYQVKAKYDNHSV